MKTGRNEPCPCGSGRKFKKCCLDRQDDLQVDAPPAASDASASLTLVMESASGGMVRRVPAAMPLRLRLPGGRAAEDAAADAASLWGMPDFVYRPAIRHKGSRIRELGDGTIVVGDLALVVQVKRRESPSSDSAKERRWVAKKTREALSQGRGTIRELNRDPAEMVNGRGRSTRIEGKNYRWVVAVVIDHESVPTGTIPVSGSELAGAVVLLRKDWEFLFDQVKSTHAVAGYLERVAGEAQELGLEAARYYELAAEDAAAAPAPIPLRLKDLGGKRTSEPLLPLAPAAHESLSPHLLFRAVLEDVALAPLRGAEDRRSRVLAELDSLPITQRAVIGGLLSDALDACADAPSTGTLWRMRRVVAYDGVTQLGFGVCNRLDAGVRAAFEAWVHLRHHEFLATVPAESAEPVTVAVLLTPRSDRNRPWDTTLYSVGGWHQLSRKERDACVALWSDSKTASTRATVL